GNDRARGRARQPHEIGMRLVGLIEHGNGPAQHAMPPVSVRVVTQLPRQCARLACPLRTACGIGATIATFPDEPMATATLSISSKNYSSWSLRGWLLAKFSGIQFQEVAVPPDDADARKELLLLSPSILVPCLTWEGIKVWDTLAIAEF